MVLRDASARNSNALFPYTLSKTPLVRIAAQAGSSAILRVFGLAGGGIVEGVKGEVW